MYTESTCKHIVNFFGPLFQIYHVYLWFWAYRLGILEPQRAIASFKVVATGKVTSSLAGSFSDMSWKIPMFPKNQEVNRIIICT